MAVFLGLTLVALSVLFITPHALPVYLTLLAAITLLAAAAHLTRRPAARRSRTTKKPRP